MDRGREAPLPGELSYLAPHLGREGFFKRYYRFGPTPERLAADAASWVPDHVFISSFAYCYAAEAIETADACRKRMPEAAITIGGAGVSAYPEYYLRNSCADYTVAGEVDASIVDFLSDPLSVPGVYYRRGDDILCTGTSVPPREYAPVLKTMHVTKNASFFSTMLTRGCPMGCAFCSARLHMPGFRKPSLDAVEEVFRVMESAPGRVHLNIEDDTIAHDFDFLLSVLELLREHAPGATFSMENGVDYRTLDGDKVRVLAGLGLSKLNVSLVSLNAGVMESYGRRSMPERFEEVALAAAGSGVPVTAYLIAGLRGETAESVRESLRYLGTLPVLIGISPFYPVPGILDFEDRSFFDGLPPRICAGTAFYSWYSCTTDELIDVFRRSRMSNLENDRENR